MTKNLRYYFDRIFRREKLELEWHYNVMMPKVEEWYAIHNDFDHEKYPMRKKWLDINYAILSRPPC